MRKSESRKGKGQSTCHHPRGGYTGEYTPTNYITYIYIYTEVSRDVKGELITCQENLSNLCATASWATASQVTCDCIASCPKGCHQQSSQQALVKKFYNTVFFITEMSQRRMSLASELCSRRAMAFAVSRVLMVSRCFNSLRHLTSFLQS